MKMLRFRIIYIKLYFVLKNKEILGVNTVMYMMSVEALELTSCIWPYVCKRLVTNLLVKRTSCFHLENITNLHLTSMK